jgi:hypothetical protein
MGVGEGVSAERGTRKMKRGAGAGALVSLSLSLYPSTLLPTDLGG